MTSSFWDKDAIIEKPQIQSTQSNSFWGDDAVIDNGQIQQNSVTPNNIQQETNPQAVSAPVNNGWANIANSISNATADLRANPVKTIGKGIADIAVGLGQQVGQNVANSWNNGGISIPGNLSAFSQGTVDFIPEVMHGVASLGNSMINTYQGKWNNPYLNVPSEDKYSDVNMRGILRDYQRGNRGFGETALALLPKNTEELVRLWNKVNGGEYSGNLANTMAYAKEEYPLANFAGALGTPVNMFLGAKKASELSKAQKAGEAAKKAEQLSKVDKAKILRQRERIEKAKEGIGKFGKSVATGGAFGTIGDYENLEERLQGIGNGALFGAGAHTVIGGAKFAGKKAAPHLREASYKILPKEVQENAKNKINEYRQLGKLIEKQNARTQDLLTEEDVNYLRSLNLSDKEIKKLNNALTKGVVFDKAEYDNAVNALNELRGGKKKSTTTKSKEEADKWFEEAEKREEQKQNDKEIFADDMKRMQEAWKNQQSQPKQKVTAEFVSEELTPEEKANMVEVPEENPNVSEGDLSHVKSETDINTPNDTKTPQNEPFKKPQSKQSDKIKQRISELEKELDNNKEFLEEENHYEPKDWDKYEKDSAELAELKDKLKEVEYDESIKELIEKTSKEDSPNMDKWGDEDSWNLEEAEKSIKTNKNELQNKKTKKTKQELKDNQYVDENGYVVTKLEPGAAKGSDELYKLTNDKSENIYKDVEKEPSNNRASDMDEAHKHKLEQFDKKYELREVVDTYTNKDGETIQKPSKYIIINKATGKEITPQQKKALQRYFREYKERDLTQDERARAEREEAIEDDEYYDKYDKTNTLNPIEDESIGKTEYKVNAEEDAEFMKWYNRFSKSTEGAKAKMLSDKVRSFKTREEANDFIQKYSEQEERVNSGKRARKIGDESYDEADVSETERLTEAFKEEGKLTEDKKLDYEREGVKEDETTEVNEYERQANEWETNREKSGKALIDGYEEVKEYKDKKTGEKYTTKGWKGGLAKGRFKSFKERFNYMAKMNHRNNAKMQEFYDEAAGKILRKGNNPVAREEALKLLNEMADEAMSRDSELKINKREYNAKEAIDNAISKINELTEKGELSKARKLAGEFGFNKVEKTKYLSKDKQNTINDLYDKSAAEFYQKAKEMGITIKIENGGVERTNFDLSQARKWCYDWVDKNVKDSTKAGQEKYKFRKRDDKVRDFVKANYAKLYDRYKNIVRVDVLKAYGGNEQYAIKEQSVKGTENRYKAEATGDVKNRDSSNVDEAKNKANTRTEALSKIDGEDVHTEKTIGADTIKDYAKHYKELSTQEIIDAKKHWNEIDKEYSNGKSVPTSELPSTLFKRVEKIAAFDKVDKINGKYKDLETIDIDNKDYAKYGHNEDLKNYAKNYPNNKIIIIDDASKAPAHFDYDTKNMIINKQGKAKGDVYKHERRHAEQALDPLTEPLFRELGRINNEIENFKKQNKTKLINAWKAINEKGINVRENKDGSISLPTLKNIEKYAGELSSQAFAKFQKLLKKSEKHILEQDAKDFENGIDNGSVIEQVRRQADEFNKRRRGTSKLGVNDTRRNSSNGEGQTGISGKRSENNQQTSTQGKGEELPEKNEKRNSREEGTVANYPRDINEEINSMQKDPIGYYESLPDKHKKAINKVLGKKVAEVFGKAVDLSKATEEILTDKLKVLNDNRRFNELVNEYASTVFDKDIADLTAKEKAIAKTNVEAMMLTEAAHENLYTKIFTEPSKQELSFFGKDKQDALLGTKQGKAKRIETLEDAKKVFAGMMARQRRYEALSNTIDFVVKHFSKPYELTDRFDIKERALYEPVNLDLLKLAMFKRGSKKFYKTLKNGKEAIKEAFKGEDIMDELLALHSQANTPDIMLPRHIINALLDNSGESLAVRGKRYGWGEVAKGSVGTLLDIRNHFFKRRVLGLSPKWFINNRIGNALMMAKDYDNPLEFVQDMYRATKVTEKDLPMGVLDSNILDAVETFKTVQTFTGYKPIDDTLNILSGKKYGIDELKQHKSNLEKQISHIKTKISNKDELVKKLKEVDSAITKANAVNFFTKPLRFVQKAIDLGYKINDVFEQHERKMLYLNRARKAYKEQLADKNEIQRVATNMLRQTELLDWANNNPKAKERIKQQMLDTLGDYNNLTNIERGLLRRVFPFYKWMKVITKNTYKFIKEQPERAAIFLYELKRLADSNSDKVDWQKYTVDLGNGNVLNLEKMIPYNTFSEMADGVMNLVNPSIREGYEGLIKGRKTFADQQIKNSRYSDDNYYLKDFQRDKWIKQRRLFDNKKQDFVKDKKGEYKNSPPLSTRLGYMGTQAANDLLPIMDNNLVSLPEVGSAISNKKQGKGLIPKQGKYDVGWGRYNNGDRVDTRYLKKDSYRADDRKVTEYDTKDYLLRKVLPMQKAIYNNISKMTPEEKEQYYKMIEKAQKAKKGKLYW